MHSRCLHGIGTRTKANTAFPLRAPLHRSSHNARQIRHTSNEQQRSDISVSIGATISPEQITTSPTKGLLGNLDHRQLAQTLNIYTTHATSRGSPLFFPDGAHVLLKLQEFLRAQYAVFGFEEVITPVIYKQSLWEQSGHWQNYGKDMFEVVGRGASGETAGKEIGENERFGLKPMNCPGHCLLYKAQNHSARNLPIRYADFSPLHRNEISGALTGLTRVRRFHQDDGHIFCREDQVGAEIQKTLQLVGRVYQAFGLGPFHLVLSTRDEQNYMGTVATWDRAEAQLTEALQASGIEWTLNTADAAFYGPKIDVMLRDRNGKEHQTATIQLDFQLPERFGLEYSPTSATKDAEDEQRAELLNIVRETAATGAQAAVNPLATADKAASLHRPVLIHRAILGSLERFLALLLEHTQGRLPLWLSPRQVHIMTVRSGPELVAYAEHVATQIRGFAVATDEESAAELQPLGTERINATVNAAAQPLPRKVAIAHDALYCILVTVGQDDSAAGTVTVDLSRMSDTEPVALGLHALGVPVPRNTKELRRVRMTAAQLRSLILRLTAQYL